MKRFGALIAVVLSLLLLVVLAISLLTASPVDAAKDKCVEQGWQEQDLIVMGFKSSGGIFSRSGRVQFQTKNQGPPKTIRVELRKPVYSLRWQVVEYDESGGEFNGVPWWQR